MPNTKDLIMGERIVAILKGEPGCGKSGAAGAFPGVYCMDLDQRIMSMLKTHPGKEIEYDQFTSLDQVLKKIEDLVAYNPFDTIWIASLTTLANMCINYSMKYRGVADAEARGAKAVMGLARGKVKMTDVSDWGVEFRALSDIIDALKMLKSHVLLEAHVLEVTRENIIKNTSTTTRTLMTGGKKIAAYIPTCFDEAWHFYIEPSISEDPPKFKCATVNVGEDWAKTALHLPPTFDWTDRDFYAIIQHFIKNPWTKPTAS